MITRLTVHVPSLVVLAGSAVLAMTVASGCDHRGRPASLSRPASGEAAFPSAGFIQRWLILEPIPVSGQLTDGATRATVKAEYFPGQLTLVPRDHDKVIVAGAELTWHTVDTNDYNVNLYYFAQGLGKPTSNVLFWAVTIIDCDEEIPGVRLAVGSNASSVWWVNGNEAIGLYGDRQTVIDDGVSKRLTLQKGPNVVRCAVVNAGGATDFCARFLDGQDRPLKRFTVGTAAARAGQRTSRRP
jgi:hypothetical protein